LCEKPVYKKLTFLADFIKIIGPFYKKIILGPKLLAQRTKGQLTIKHTYLIKSVKFVQKKLKMHIFTLENKIKAPFFIKKDYPR